MKTIVLFLWFAPVFALAQKNTDSIKNLSLIYTISALRYYSDSVHIDSTGNLILVRKGPDNQLLAVRKVKLNPESFVAPPYKGGVPPQAGRGVKNHEETLFTI